MKPAAERKADLADRLAKAGTADQIASAIVDAIDLSLAGRGRPGRRDRSPADDEDRRPPGSQR